MNFLLFAGDDYYPNGGAYDCLGAFETVDAAIAAHDPNRFRYKGGWANVLDLQSLKVVRDFSRGVWRVTDLAVPVAENLLP